MSEPLQLVPGPKMLHDPAPRVVPAVLILGPPNAIASQLVWTGQPLAAVALTGFLATVMLVWFWRVRP